MPIVNNNSKSNNLLSTFPAQSSQKNIIAIFSSTLAIIIALTYWFARLGFENNSFLTIVKVLGLGFFILLLPDFIDKHRLKNKIAPRWTNSNGAVITIGLTLAAIAGLLAALLHFSLAALFIVAGYYFFYRVVFVSFFKLSAKAIISLVIFTLLFAILIIGIVWDSGYLNPLFFEKIAGGSAHLDSLFLISLTNIIKNYNIPSTGLDGLPYVPYHWGSSWIFAQLSRLLSINAITCYNLVYPAIFIPFFFKSALSFSLNLGEARGAKDQLDYKFWLIPLVGFAGFLPITLMLQMALGWNSIFISESYLLALAFSFNLAAVILAFCSNFKGKFQRIDAFFLIFIPLLIGMIGLLKISVMMLILCACSYAFLRYQLFRKLPFTLIYALTILVGAVVYKFTSTIGNEGGYVPYDFINTYVSKPFQSLFSIFHYFWAWVFILWRVYYSRIKTLSDLKHNLITNKMVDVEILIIIAIAGFVPGAVFAINGGSAIYFSEVQKWLAIFLLLAYLPQSNAKSTSTSLLKNIAALPALSLIFALLAIPSISALYYNIRLPFVDFIQNNIYLRGAIIDTKDWPGHFTNISQLINKQRYNPVQAVRSTLQAPQNKLNEKTEYRLINELTKLGDLPSNEKRKTALFVPQQNNLYWNLLTYKKIQFLAPAVSGLAMIDGIQPYIPTKLTNQFYNKSIKKEITSIEDLEFIKKAYGVDSETRNAISPDGNETELAKSYTLRNDLSEADKSKLYDLLTQVVYADLAVHSHGYGSYHFPTEHDFIENTKDDGSLCQSANAKGLSRIIVIGNQNSNLESRIIPCN